MFPKLQVGYAISDTLDDIYNILYVHDPASPKSVVIPTSPFICQDENILSWHAIGK